ncbi:TPM domain-containing protein [Gordonia sp. HNM0687]|uniref:TPM domain-containing protein n=1 Tax=Gordonia mangrovi TaxID=2665643 RepID=A0A6L7GNE1_9ACTN|nr:TPM domain-containing protein [Gordonia mangrovi]MXP21459.1 TPM domain-containing protein [Gordonia mangrovi]UVF80205.1 TPM domain-containing protein [Gordonia mangrovi]
MLASATLLRRLGLTVAVLGLVALVAPAVLLSARAHAEPPSRLPTQVVDSANVLTTAQRTDLQASIDQLYTDHEVQLWVVYVRDFDGMSAEQWATQTAAISDLGDTDVLLAVATDDRAYYFNAPESVEGLDQSAIEDIARGDIVPALKDSDWAGAGQAAVDGINAAMTPSNAGLYTALAVGGVAVVGGGGFLLYRRRRKRQRIEAGVEAMREQELTGEQLVAQPLDVLDPWSREVLTDTDNAIRTSEEELALAISEFGQVETAPFTEALAEAKRGLAESFTVRQLLDDSIPETPDEQRAMLVQIITTCTDVDAALDAQVESFDAMRNLLINADSRLAELTQKLVAVRARMEQSQIKLDSLIGRHGETVLVSITDNVDLAREEIEFAEHSADQGREAVSAPAGEQGPAVAAIRSAEGALEQANRLLDAIDNAEANIAAAHTRMPALIDEVDGELAEAAALSGDGGPALATAVQRATSALSAARTEFGDDPLGTFTALVDADADLDDALADARASSAERQRRAELLNSAVTAAQAKVSAANDFISTRRGAIQSTARTRLAEAQRLLAEATAAGTTDAVRAAQSARRAGYLADQALMAAQGDVVQWQQNQTPHPTGPSVGGAVLGGILVDSFLRGTMGGGRGGWGGGGFGGGYGSGGRSPGSFGGSGSSGRIGVGGRF